MISAKKKYEPFFLEIIRVFLPIQPSPDFSAQALSITGAESTKTLALKSPIFSIKDDSNFFSLFLITK